MTCREIDPLIEAFAAGDLSPRADQAAHLETCARCAGRLGLARRIDRVLALAGPPRAAPDFAGHVLSRIRRNRWRAERYVDIGFNVAIAAGLLLVAVGVWLLLNLSGLTAVGTDAVNLMAAGFSALVRQIAPAVPIYAGAIGLLLTALLVWWWAEHEQISQ